MTPVIFLSMIRTSLLIPLSWVDSSTVVQKTVLPPMTSPDGHQWTQPMYRWQTQDILPLPRREQDPVLEVPSPTCGDRPPYRHLFGEHQYTQMISSGCHHLLGFGMDSELMFKSPIIKFKTNDEITIFLLEIIFRYWLFLSCFKENLRDMSQS